QTAPYEITNELAVTSKATLTLAAGVELAIAENQQISVGFDDEGGFKALGTAEKPVKIHGAGSGAWKAIYLYGKARGCELSHVDFEGAGGDAALIVEKDAEVKASDLTCTKCAAATLTSECGARLTSANVKGGEGTPKD